MSDSLSSRPRKMPRTGNIGATAVWCSACQRFHNTHRSLNPEPCPVMREERPLAPVFIQKEKLGTQPKKRVAIPFRS